MKRHSGQSRPDSDPTVPFEAPQDPPPFIELDADELRYYQTRNMVPRSAIERAQGRASRLGCTVRITADGVSLIDCYPGRESTPKQLPPYWET